MLSIFDMSSIHMDFGWSLVISYDLLLWAILDILVTRRRKLRRKLPTILTNGKAEVGRVRVGKRKRVKIREQKDRGRRKKMKALERRVRSHLSKWEMKNCTPVWCEANLEFNMYKSTAVLGHFWNSRC